MNSIDGSQWSQLQWRRRLETFGANDASVLASGPNQQTDGICNLGELTDKGRETTLALGQRLRKLYVDQLHFMPPIISDADMIYLRATPMPRALESVQQSFWGLYPLSARTASFPPPTILTRTPQEETLFPNEASCRRFSQLLRAFGQRTADRWNPSPEMAYLSSKMSSYMPDEAPVRVDSHPRLSGIMDTINSTLAHGPATRLPPPFYDPKARAIIDAIGVEEWFSGYKESAEYRTVGIGALAGDIVARMLGSVEHAGNDGLLEVGGRGGGGDGGGLGEGKGEEKALKMGLSGCHDTTLAALLASLGAFEGEHWPPYTSHLAFELFRDGQQRPGAEGKSGNERLDRPATSSGGFGKQAQSTWATWLGGTGKAQPGSEGFTRKRIDAMNAAEREKLRGWFVRVRYNDRVVSVPGCEEKGKHWEGERSLCTLVSFWYPGFMPILLFNFLSIGLEEVVVSFFFV